MTKTRDALFAPLLVAAFAVSAAVPPARAEFANPHGMAVVTGNQGHRNEQAPEVGYAHRDAEALERYVLGFDPNRIFDPRDATQAEPFTRFGNRESYEGRPWRYLHPRHGSDVVVYYSGHGAPGLKDRRGDRVTFARPFAVGGYEVTFREREACVSGGGCGGYRPGDRGRGRGKRPVIDVNWRDAQGYVEWPSGETDKEYRSLGESGWEYVARAGTTGRHHFGSRISSSRANYGNDEGGTVPAGSYSADGFGLHDVHGNVRGWVEDCWNESYPEAPGDGSGWESGNCGWRVLQGGSWDFVPAILGSALHYWYYSGFRIADDGFRAARTLD